MKSPNEIQRELSGFTGTESYTKYTFGLLLTDGAVHMAKICQAFWLLDIVASLKFHPKARREPFLSITLTKHKNNNGATFTADDGNKNIVYTQIITDTDFPLDEIKMYFTDNVLMLRSEY